MVKLTNKLKVQILFILILLVGLVVATFYLWTGLKSVPSTVELPAQTLTPTLEIMPTSTSNFTELWLNGERCPKEGFVIPAKKEDIIQVGNNRVYVNVVEVLFTDEATCRDAERIAQLINGKIKGFEPTTNLYGFFIPTHTIEELDAAINKIEALNDPKITAVSEVSLIRAMPMPF